jgi:crotonobetainyl-CoA:carnitine CoA-transferase CaiB-like acyl-CoA transferase
VSVPRAGHGPLDGISVVELASYVSGPLATAMLADLGADVVKVEPPGGDPFRRFGRSGHPASPIFVNSNRGKRGIVLDLKDPSDLAQLGDLLDEADVLLSNWRPAVAERLGLSDDVIAARHPGLIRVYVSGFGETGPSANAPVYDSIIQAHVGSAEMAPPAIVPSYPVDKFTATMACQATLAALLERERGGPARRVDLALLDAASYWSFVDMMVNRTFTDGASVEASNGQAAAIRGVRTSDGWLVVVPVTADQIRRTCAAIGRPSLADELLAMSDATALTTRLMDEIETSTRTASTSHWLDAFARADVPAGPCLTIDQHLADGQVNHNHIYEVDEWPGLGHVRRVRYPARFSGHGELWPRSGPPAAPPRRVPKADRDD